MNKYTDEYLDSLDAFEIFNLWKESDEGKAREKLHAAFNDLREDVDIKKSPVCMDFLRLITVFDPSDAEIFDIQDIVDKLNGAFNKLRAVKNATKRHAPSRDAKNFVVTEWANHRGAYDHNKSAFTRDYVRRVFNEFEVSVTEKQMREVWLKDAPPASKPDGLPVNG